MNPRFRLALVVGGLLLMAVLVRQVGVATIAGMVAQVGWAFVTMVVLYSLHSVLRALVLWISLHPALPMGDAVRPAARAYAVPFLDVLRIRFSGEAVEALTYTGPLLAEPAKGMLLTSRGVPTVNAFAAISLEYLLYTVSSAAFGAAAAVLLLQHRPLPPGLHGAAWTLLFVMLAFIAGTIVAAVTGVGLIAPALRALNAMIGGDRVLSALTAVTAVERELVAFLHTQPSRVLVSIVLECLSHALLMTDVWVVLHALRLPASVRDLLVIEGSAKLVAFVFFFVPAQLGATEGSNALIFPIIALPVAAGVTLALVRRVRSLCIAAIGIAASGTLR